MMLKLQLSVINVAAVAVVNEAAVISVAAVAVINNAEVANAAAVADMCRCKCQ